MRKGILSCVLPIYSNLRHYLNEGMSDIYDPTSSYILRYGSLVTALGTDKCSIVCAAGVPPGNHCCLEFHHIPHLSILKAALILRKCKTRSKRELYPVMY